MIRLANSVPGAQLDLLLLGLNATAVVLDIRDVVELVAVLGVVAHLADELTGALVAVVHVVVVVLIVVLLIVVDVVLVEARAAVCARTSAAGPTRLETYLHKVARLAHLGAQTVHALEHGPVGRLRLELQRLVVQTLKLSVDVLYLAKTFKFYF